MNKYLCRQIKVKGNANVKKSGQMTYVIEKRIHYLDAREYYLVC